MRPCHRQPERRLFIRLICLRQGSGIVRIITRDVIITVLSGTYGREQPLRALSQTQPNWLGLISSTGTHRSALREASITVPADGDKETGALFPVSKDWSLQQGEGGCTASRVNRDSRRVFMWHDSFSPKVLS